MFIGTCIKVILLTLTCYTLTKGEQRGYDWQDDGVLLSAAELTNLIRQEQREETSSETKHKGFSLHTEKITTANDVEPKDDDTLKARKVWSRWSKWTKCSNSCGYGTMSRRRLCVAGKCAPGEKEEQHRTCELAPCKGYEAPVTFQSSVEVPSEIDTDPDALEGLLL